MSVHSPSPVSQKSQHLAGFLAALEAEGVTARNREAHRCAVERLGEFMAPRGAEEATHADLRSFLAYLGELGVSLQSQGVYRAVLVKWMDHMAALAPAEGTTATASDASDATVEFSSDPVDQEQTWPLWRKAAAAAAAQAAAAAAAQATPLTSHQSDDFGSAFDVAAAAARAAQTISAGSWDDLEAQAMESVEDALARTVNRAMPPSRGFDFAAPPPAQGEAPVVSMPVPTPVAVAQAIATPEPRVVTPAPPATPFVTTVPASTQPEAHAFGFEAQAEAFPPQAAAAPAPPCATPSPSAMGSATAAPSAATSPEAHAFGFAADTPGASTTASAPPALPAPPSMSWSGTEAPSEPDVVGPPPPRVTVGFGLGDGMSAGRSGATPGRTGTPPVFIKAPPMPTTPVDDGVFDVGYTPQAPVSRKGARSIPLAMGGDEGDVVALGADDSLSVQREAVPMLDDTLQGWSIRHLGVERKDLSLSEIRNLALSGEIQARTMVRRPGGEWMQAGEFHPLRSALITAAETSRAGGRRRSPLAFAEDAPPAIRTALAWAGAVGGATIASLGWWLGAVVAGRELAVLAILGGLIGGFGASWLSRAEGRRAGLPGAASGLIAPLLGHLLVYETLLSGAIPFATPDEPPSLLRFMVLALPAGFTLCVLAAVGLGAVLGAFGAGRSR